MFENPAFEIAQLRARLDTDFVDQGRARPLVGLECTGRLTRPVLGQHQQPPPGLDERLVHDQGAKFRHRCDRIGLDGQFQPLDS